MAGTYCCYNCLNPIPANTLVCPHCGEVQRRGAQLNNPKYYLAVILSIIVIVCWNWYGGGQKTHVVTPPPSASLPAR
jgi:predicted nucleic acid-binding Zn ribbon protein